MFSVLTSIKKKRNLHEMTKRKFPTTTKNLLKRLKCLNAWEPWIKDLIETKRKERQAHPINCFHVHAERLWAGSKQKAPRKDLRDNCIPIYNCIVVTKGSLNICDGNEMNYVWGERGEGQDVSSMKMVTFLGSYEYLPPLFKELFYSF